MKYPLFPSTKTFRPVWLIFSLFAVGLAFAAGLHWNDDRFQTASTDAVFQGKLNNKPGAITRGNDIDFALFWNVWDTLKKEYVDSGVLTDKKLFYGALRGLVASTGDPYTVFMNPEEATDFEEDLSGTFEGIGAEIGIRNNDLIIIAPLEDMPAMKAGVRAGDRIYAIDGKTAVNLSVEEAVKKIRGAKGTTVTLTLVREKVDKPIEVAIKRDTVVVKSVKTTWNEKDKVFIIKVYNFNNDTKELFNQAVAEALTKKPAGLILDLRNNPGGYLDTAVAMASKWVNKGTIVSEQFGNGEKIDHDALGSSPLADMPTAILVNQGSASASEIVAGALKDYGKAVLIGEKTFGKGSVQILRQLEDGSVVKVTTAKWLTPKGSSIHEKGIQPDIVVERTTEDREKEKDPQYERAEKELLKKVHN